MAANERKRVMCVGLCCLDVVSVVQSFPAEDTDQRSLDYYWQRGGNASNSASVISILGGNSEYMGTLVKSQEYGFLTKSFSAYNISVENCRIYSEEEFRCPVTVVIINKQNGSRTILAALKYIAELKYEDFEKVSLEKYKWVHFEGRDNIENITRMIDRITAFNETVQASDRVQTSLELEKTKRTNLLPLAQRVDYLFVSKEFAGILGYHNKEEAVTEMIDRCKPSGTVVCAWGEDGAAAKSGSRDVVTSPIFPPETLVDTLGAGDTFNAATILALSKGQDLRDAIIYGCKVAGAKCVRPTVTKEMKIKNETLKRKMSVQIAD